MRRKALILVNQHIWLYKLRKELIGRLMKEGYQVYLSLPYGEFVDYFKELGCIFIDTPFELRNKGILSNLSLIRSYRKIMKEIQPDVVLTYTVKPNLYGAYASGKKIPCICNITGLGSGFKKAGFTRSLMLFLYRHCIKRADYIFFQNEEDEKVLLEEGVISGDYGLLPGSGVNLQEFQLVPYPSDSAEIRFNFIGRIMEDKGIDQYLEAAELVRKNHPEAVFRIYGYVEKTQPWYQKKIEEFAKRGAVEFKGFREDIRPEIADSHCTIQPAVYGEGLSNVILESSAMGKAIIASDLSGCRSGVDEGKSGLVFHAGDTADLVKKIEAFLALSGEEKAKLGICGREKVEREFSREIVVDSYLKVIKELVDPAETGKVVPFGKKGEQGTANDLSEAGEAHV